MRPSEIAELLGGRQVKPGQWEARCPAHDDRRASLSIGSGDDGRTLLTCHAGCELSHVVAAAGIKLRDLAPPEAIAKNGKARGRIVERYSYRDEGGALLYQVLRMEPKDFRQRRPDGSGGWQWSTKGVRRVLYRLPELLAADPARPVHVVEGEKDADRLVAHGLEATCNAGGAGKRKWPDDAAEALRGRDVVILPDNDDEGRKHAQRVARSLHGAARSIRIVELPGLPSKGDVSDFLREHDIDELGAIVARTSEWGGPVAFQHPNAPGGGDEPPPLDAADAGGSGKGPKPEIVLSTDLAGMVTQLEDALLGLGGVYVRAGGLAQVVLDVSTPNWLDRPDGTPTIKPLAKERLRELAGIAADWRKVQSKGDDVELVPIMPPKDVVETLRARDQWRFDPLEGVVDAPVLRPDGSIFDSPGYDPVTRLIYAPGPVAFPEIPRTPSHADAGRALEAILEPFADFPFVDTAAISAVAAMLLTMVGRSAIPGCAPMFMIQAPTPGSGKGLAVDSAAIIATGHRSPKMTQADDDEMRKRMLSLAMSAPHTVCLDNVSGALYSPALESALTDGVIHDRVLGASKQATATLRAVWTLTGNNVALKGDLGRRVVPIDLDPEMEHPEDRTGFRHPNLIRFLRGERPRLYVQALTVLRAHAVAGRPTHGGARKGSYEDWDDVIRSAIIWAGGGDPLEGVKTLREEGDVELDQLRALLTSWRELYGDERQTIAGVVGDVAEKEARHDERRVTVREALTAYSGRLDTRALGYALRKVKGRLVGGLKLVSAKVGGKRWWRVIAPATEDEDSGWEERHMQTDLEGPF